MDRIILERFLTSDQGTFGKIRIDEKIFYTLELPWRDNHNNYSCIPAGIYECEISMSPHLKKRTYLLQSVNNRTGIRIHSANLAGDKTLGYRAQLNGCIALGLKIGVIEDQRGVILSAPAVRQFESIMDRQNFILEVINAY